MKLKKLMSEPEYRKLPHISYSKLSSLDKSPLSLKGNNIKMTDPLIYGSAVDVLIFDGREEFDKKFTTITCSKPQYKLLTLIESLFEETKNSLKLGEEINNDINTYEKRLLKLARIIKFGGENWGDEAILRNAKKGAEYFKALVETYKEKKLILSPQQYEYIINSVNTLKTHPFTKKYFDEKQEGIDIYFQFPIVWSYQEKDIEVHCKSLLDILIIDHNQKLIKPVDLKTSGKSIYSFPSSFIEWKYYLQASFYTDAVKYLKEQYEQIKDYEVDLFKFVVISSKNPIKPLVFQIDYYTYIAGKYGGILSKEHNYCKGYLRLVKELKWHIDNNKYLYPKEIYDEDGLILLNVFEK